MNTRIKIIRKFSFVFLILASFFTLKATLYSFENALDHYGFRDPAKKEDIRKLFELSSLIHPGESFNDAFPPRENLDEFLDDLLKIIEKTQQTFTVRKGTEERWQVTPASWIDGHQEDIIKALRALGFVNEITPTHISFDAVCILGATIPRMKGRVSYTESLLERGIKAKQLILVSGERYVTKGVDGSVEELSQIADKVGLQTWEKLTEAKALSYLAEESPLSKRKIPITLIDTPRKDLPRPTTQTTIEDLIGWLKENPDIKTLLFVSSQPYVLYQGVIIRTIFEHKGKEATFETVGTPADTSEPKTSALVESFGSFLWAGLPSVLKAMSISIGESRALKERLEALYAQTPLIYASLPF